MQIYITANDGIPIYLQIVNQIKYLVASGRLAPGEELLPIRVLAQQLLINPNTVARAYRELEIRGVLLGQFGDREDAALGHEIELKLAHRKQSQAS